MGRLKVQLWDFIEFSGLIESLNQRLFCVCNPSE